MFQKNPSYRALIVSAAGLIACAGEPAEPDPGEVGGSSSPAATGSMPSSGGSTATSGKATGGKTSGAKTNQGGGGDATGGETTAGGTGGKTADGTATGGKTADGTATGGKTADGTATGGKAAGGTATGGKTADGTATGGAATGGKAAGGTATGGAATGGKSTGGAPTGGAPTGGTTSTGVSSCGVNPVNPSATQEAKNLLCYLYSINGKSVLSGQQETSWSSPASDISWYTSNGMKEPAVLGGDYLYPSGTTDRAIAYWKAGGITMIRYHMGAPPNADSYDNSKGTANIDSVLRSGSSENSSFNSKLDYVAKELQKLQDANVPVLWAPFHETQPGGWFWWSKGTGTQFVALWKYMYNYLTTTKGLNNLIWLMPFSGTPNSGYYPGKDVVDIAGPDTYAENEPFSSMYSSTRNIVGGNMPIPLHETGRIPTPSKMFPSSAPWVLFNIWAGYQKDSHNSVSNIKSVYESTYTITRDEVPNLK